MNNPNTIMLGGLIDILIDAEKQPHHRQKMLRHDSIVTAIEMSDFPDAWKEERLQDLRLAMQYGVMPNLSAAVVESVPQDNGRDQAVIHPNTHLPNMEAL